MSQSEISEVSEPVSEGRGGSSTMPQKKNPVGCATALAAATRVPALVSSYLTAMVQEHERGVGGSQAEWPIATDIVQATGAAAHSIADLSEGLMVDPARMRENLQSRRGTIFAEKATVLLGKKIGKSRAHKLLGVATTNALKQKKSLADALREMPEAREHMEEAVLTKLDVPEDYLGSAEWFRKRLLENPIPKSEHK
jgi:3-carboxy-cis,cis-muconate cycloisomerase